MALDRTLRQSMLRELAVPLVQQDLSSAETYSQLADSLEALIASSDAVVDRIIAHASQETGVPPAPHHPNDHTGCRNTAY